ncbi:MAG: ATP-binding protein [Lentimicrobiaceae bacterium]|jgi:NadR type nicotinamide-nucleotide adenylyltransferase|nr:ATP-binding protein [Lentimicrobiaceae bacterium]
MLKIAITGPESTGKSSLAKSLAEIYGVKAIPEYAREYLSNFELPYTIDDIVKIAREQERLIKEKATTSDKILIADTELLVCKIWTIFVFNKVPEFIRKAFAEQQFDLYLLCDIDLAWEADPLRENPSKSERKQLFEMYRVALEQANCCYAIISGKDEQRVQNAIKMIGALIEKNK